MACSCSDKMDTLLRDTYAQREEMLKKQRAQEEKLKAEAARLAQIDQASRTAVAMEQLRYNTLKEAEVKYKLRERDLLEKQLEESMANTKRVTDLYEAMASTVTNMSETLRTPANLFKVSTVVEADTIQDAYKIVYDDGRVVYIPFEVINVLLADKLTAINEIMDEAHKREIALRRELNNTNENLHQLSTVVTSSLDQSAARDAELRAMFDVLREEVRTHLEGFNRDIIDLTSAIANTRNIIDRLHLTVENIIVND